MAAGSLVLYSAHKGRINLFDLQSAPVKLALLKSTYTPDTRVSLGHVIWSTISAEEIAAGHGYTAGGLALSNKGVTDITGGRKFVSSNLVWTATGGPIPAWRYGVLYVAGSLWGYSSPLLGYFLGDATPADVPATTDNNTLTIACPADGWFDVT